MKEQREEKRAEWQLNRWDSKSLIPYQKSFIEIGCGED